MKNRYIVEVFGILVILLFFSIVVLVKYYDKPKTIARDVVLENSYFVVLDGHRVANYVDVNDLEKEYKLNVEGSISNFSGNAKSVTIFNYHGITPVENGVDVTLDDFKAQMFELKRNGYQTITLEELYGFLRNETVIPNKSFMITFDDGRRDSFYYADPIFEVLDYNAVIFVISKQSIFEDSNYYLSKNELKDLLATNRWEIQSHSYGGHERTIIAEDGSVGSFFGNKLWLEDKQRVESDEEYKVRIEDDLLLSKYSLEKNLDVEINSFAIPFSDFGQFNSNLDDAEKINEEIYKKYFNMVFYQYKPLKNKDYKSNYFNKVDDFYFVMRVTVEPNTEASELIKEIDATMAKSMPYNEDFSNEYNWVKSWGNYELNDDSMIIRNNANYKTSLIYLDGSYLFEDYVYSVGIEDAHNVSLVLIARFENSQNYVSCSFMQDYVVFESFGSGDKKEIHKQVLPSGINYDDEVVLGVRVYDDNVACLIDNQSIVERKSEFVPEFGGVGIKSVLYPYSDNGFALVRLVKVLEI